MVALAAQRVPAIAAVALLLVTAGCMGALGVDDRADRHDVNATDENQPSAADEPPKANELLNKSLESQSNVGTVHGVQTVTVERGNETVTTTQEVWQRGSTAHRTEILESSRNQTFEVTVANGTTTWMYNEDTNEAVRMDLHLNASEQEAIRNASTSIYGDMNATLEGTTTVADRKTYVLDLSAGGENATFESATFWVDAETHYPLKMQSTTSIAGEMTTTMEFENVSFNETFSDDRFTFEPPEDATVRNASNFTTKQFDTIDEAETVAPFDLPEPAVPGDYDRQNITVSESMSGWSGSLRYTNETGGYLTVIVSNTEQESMVDSGGESVEIGDTNTTATLHDDGPLGITRLSWTDDGLKYTVTGDSTAETLISVAESIIE